MNEHASGEHPSAKKLWRQRKLVGACDLFVSLAVTVALLRGYVEPWASLTQQLTPSPWLRALAFSALLGAAYGIAGFPFSIARHALSRKYGLSTQTPGAWFADQLKGLALGGALGSIVVLGLTATVMQAGDHWWWIATLGALLFGIVLTRLVPPLIIPIFFKMKRLESPELQSRFTALGERTKTPVLGIYEINLSSKTTAANAAVVGFGGSRRAVVGDTLLANFSLDEIEFVLAHELAHHKYHDLWWGIAAAAVSTLVSLGAAHFVLVERLPGWRADFDPIVLFWIALIVSVCGAVFGPVHKWLSRRAESRADRFAAQATGKAAAGAESFRKLGFQNLARFEPPWLEEALFYTHPSIGRRIARLSKF